MALRIWFPFNKDLHNQGLNCPGTSVTGATYQSTGGKLGGCYYGNGHGLGIKTTDKVDLGNNLTFACWFKFTSLNSNSSLGATLVSLHEHSKNTGLGITIKYISSTTGYISANTGTGSSRTYNKYCGSTLLQANTWYHVAMTYSNGIITFYLNGVQDGLHSIGTLSVPSNYIVVGNWSVEYFGYGLNGYLNDVRVYSHSLSPSEVKELSMGKVLHIPGNEVDTIPTDNKFAYPTPGANCANNYAWDKTLHANAISVTNWASGYNGGVTNPTTVYHAHWILMDGLPTMRFPYVANSSGEKPGWLGISGGVPTVSEFTAGRKYTVSFDAKADENGSCVMCGLYYIKTGASNYTFNDGNIETSLTTEWKRYSITYTCAGALTISSFIFYGKCSGPVGNRYIRNILFEWGEIATPYARTTRTGVAHDISGLHNDLTPQGSPGLTGDTKRYERACVVGTGSLSTSGLTLSCPYTISFWVKVPNDYAFTSNVYMIRWNGSSNMIYGDHNGYYLYSLLSAGTLNAASGWNKSGWNHIVITDDGSYLRSYVNNTTGPYRVSPNTGVSNIIFGPGYADLTISDARLYATVLSESDRTELYKLGN